MGNAVKQLLEFGPFRLDPEQRLLLRAETPIPLTPKAFDLLLILVQRSGEVVVKDDLMKLLWPDTFVEESNLGQHVFQLRRALGDRSQGSSYIVTVPGRGYRFAQQVRALGEQATVVVQSHSRTRLVIEEKTLAPINVTASRSLNLPKRLLWGALAIVLVIATAYVYRRPAPKLTARDTIVLAEFANNTGDGVFDGALRQGLSAQLEQSPFLNLLSDRRVAQTLSLMAQPKEAHLTHDVAREVCQRTASTAVLDGSITQIGARYLLTLKATACATDQPLASAEAEANDKDHVLDAMGKVASEMRTKLGESLASVQKYDVRPENVTTPSLDALQSYSLAMQIRHGDLLAPARLFQRAIEQDPNFAMAYAQLGVIYVDLGETARGAEGIRKAYSLRDRVSERERFYISSHYDEMVTGDLDAALADYDLWAQIYPRDSAPFGGLATNYYYRGDFERLLEAVRKGAALASPSNKPGQPEINEIWSLILLNRLDEAKAMALGAQTNHVDDPMFHLTLYVIDFLRNDGPGMEHEVEVLTNNPTWGHAVLQYEVSTAAYYGRFVRAREFARQAVDIAQKGDKQQNAAVDEAQIGLAEALVGNRASARQWITSALALSRFRDVEGIAGLALSLSGDSAAAIKLANDLNHRFPQDSIIQSNYLPTIRAATHLSNEGHNPEPAKAIQALAPAAPYELGFTALEQGLSLYPVYVRGQAYLAAKEASSAATEFQKILNHPGAVQNEPIGALAHLGLGRACVHSQDTTKAKTEYETFLAIWKDADPDIPILKQAKAEYAKLQ